MNKLRTNRHLILCIFWALMVPITLFTPLKYSITFVVLMSLYANIEASASAHEARSLRKQLNNIERKLDAS